MGCHLVLSQLQASRKTLQRRQSTNTIINKRWKKRVVSNNRKNKTIKKHAIGIPSFNAIKSTYCTIIKCSVESSAFSLETNDKSNLQNIWQSFKICSERNKSQLQACCCWHEARIFFIAACHLVAKTNHKLHYMKKKTEENIQNSNRMNTANISGITRFLRSYAADNCLLYLGNRQKERWKINSYLTRWFKDFLKGNWHRIATYFLYIMQYIYIMWALEWTSWRSLIGGERPTCA